MKLFLRSHDKFKQNIFNVIQKMLFKAETNCWGRLPAIFLKHWRDTFDVWLSGLWAPEKIRTTFYFCSLFVNTENGEERLKKLYIHPTTPICSQLIWIAQLLSQPGATRVSIKISKSMVSKFIFRLLSRYWYHGKPKYWDLESDWGLSEALPIFKDVETGVSLY